MKWMEIALIVAAALVPIVTLFMVLPKKKQQDKSAEKPADKPVEKTKDDVTEKPAQKVETKSNKNDSKPMFDNVDYKAEDFRSYLKEKSKTTSAPKRKVLDKGFNSITQSWDDFMKTPTAPQKTLADDICCLSPEIQAMIFAGLLDKKF